MLHCLYYPTVLRRVQTTPKTSTNITRYLYFRGQVRRLDRFSHKAQATNWIEVCDDEESEWLVNIDPSLFDKLIEEKQLARRQ